MKNEGEDVWAFRIEDPDKNIPGRIWATEVVVSLYADLSTSFTLRLTVGSPEPSLDIEPHVSVMNDSANWQSLFAHFDYEKALSGYIATYPHHLEDGLTQHPGIKVREHGFGDRSRTDVILLDRLERPVIVECKQGPPTVADVQQLRGYLARLKSEKKLDARGILVHGGAQKLHHDVQRAAGRKPMIEIVQHRLQVDFSRCN